MAVEFEDHAAALAALDRAGIRVPKFQISSALRVSDPSPGSPGRRALERFAEDTYLHQVVVAIGRRIDAATSICRRRSPRARIATLRAAAIEWRIHFHVPVFLRTMGDLDTTQPDLETVLDLVKHARRLRRASKSRPTPGTCCRPNIAPPTMSEAIARELAWTRARLEAYDAARRGHGRRRGRARICCSPLSNLPTVWTNVLAGVRRWPAHRASRCRSRRSLPRRCSTPAACSSTTRSMRRSTPRRAPIGRFPTAMCRGTKCLRSASRCCSRASCCWRSCRIAAAGVAVGRRAGGRHRVLRLPAQGQGLRTGRDGRVPRAGLLRRGGRRARRDRRCRSRSPRW